MQKITWLARAKLGFQLSSSSKSTGSHELPRPPSPHARSQPPFCPGFQKHGSPCSPQKALVHVTPRELRLPPCPLPRWRFFLVSTSFAFSLKTLGPTGGWGHAPPCPGDMRPGKAAGRASDQPLSKRFAPHGATPVFRTGRHQSLTCAGAVSRAAKTASSSPLNGTEVGATPTTPTVLTGKQARKSQSQEEAEQGLDVLSLKGSFESPCPPPTSSPHPPHGRASTRWGQTLLDGPRAGSAWRTMGPPRADM